MTTVALITSDSLITGHQQPGRGGHTSIVVESREGEEAVILLHGREALKELAFMATHLLAQTEEAPSEEDAPVDPSA